MPEAANEQSPIAGQLHPLPPQIGQSMLIEGKHSAAFGAFPLKERTYHD